MDRKLRQAAFEHCRRDIEPLQLEGIEARLDEGIGARIEIGVERLEASVERRFARARRPVGGRRAVPRHRLVNKARHGWKLALRCHVRKRHFIPNQLPREADDRQAVARQCPEALSERPTTGARPQNQMSVDSR